MALTQESFRDPRRQYAVRVLSGFFIEGREAATVGEILYLPRSKASELIHSGKAEAVIVDSTTAKPAAAPAAAGGVVFAEPPVVQPKAAEHAAKPAKEK